MSSCVCPFTATGEENFWNLDLFSFFFFLFVITFLPFLGKRGGFFFLDDFVFLPYGLEIGEMEQGRIR